jgi:DNA helicase-2/ATP-dependent DNA helicase PcrA
MLLNNLNKEQTQAVTHNSGPLLIVAGAGTGKTTVITRRIAYLIEQGLAKPNEILALTFTEKASGEMQDRLAELLPLGFYDMWISTFHGFCHRILEAHALDIGITNEFKLINQTQAWILIHNNLEKFELDYYKPLGNPQKFISALLKHFSRAKDELITPDEYLKFAEEQTLNSDSADKPNIAKTENPEEKIELQRITEVGNAFFLYEKLLLENNYLDFANLINFTYKLFTTRPNILKHYQNKFKYILVDEFQDTNFAQYELVKLLAGSNKNLVVVGDDDQSIYKFRGASVSNILKFKSDFPTLKQITLTENYRSHQKILDLAYNFIQNNNPDRLEVKLNINKQLKNLKKPFDTKPPVEVISARDLAEEINLLAKKILEIKEQNPNSTWNDFAILLRSNSSAGEILPILNKFGIPHTFVANTGLYQKPLIAFLIAYLNTLINREDSFALYKVLCFSQFNLSAQINSFLLALSQKRTLSLYQTLTLSQTLGEMPSNAQTAIQKVLALLNKHGKLIQEKAVNEAFVEIIFDLNIKSLLEPETEENTQNREYLEQFYKKIETFTNENSDKSLHKFLHNLNLEIESGDEGDIKFDPNIGPECLKILTIHASKGLEYEFVFIPNMVELRFPTRSKGEPIEIPKPLVKDILPEGDFHMQEERRLFYVALTRAKSKIVLSWAKDYGGSKPKKPSIFLTETQLVLEEKTELPTGQVIFSTAKIPNKIINKILPKTFSFSALKAFEHCPLQYKYQYYLKLPEAGSPFFSFGQTIHKTLELYLKNYLLQKTNVQLDLFSKQHKPTLLADFKTLEELYHHNWIDEWYHNRQEKNDYKKKGIKLLKNFYDFSTNHLPNPKFLEKSFFLPLGEYKFTGKIDRADETELGLEIIDYKTGKKPNKKTQKGDLDQLYIYQWASEEFFHEKIAKLQYWYLEENQFIEEPTAQTQEIIELKHNLLTTVNLIVETIKYDTFTQAHEKTKPHDCKYLNFENKI